MKSIALLPALIACATSLSAHTAITVYNGNFGVVRDTVPLELTQGINQQNYSGVTSQLEPESVILRDPTGQIAISVVEQSYRGDPVDQQRLLQMFQGQTIRFLKTVDGKEVIQEGTIIRAPSLATTTNQYGNQQQQMLEPIIQVDGLLMTRLPGTPLFPSLGDDSILEPTLSWKLHSDAAAQFDAQLSYLTYGMSWKSDYNLVLPEEGDEVTLTGWISIDNNTGTSFQDAAIKLIAGDVNKVQPSAQLRGQVMEMAMAKSYADAPQVETKKFDEFHMYSLPLKTTLRDSETKQVEFVRAEKVTTNKLYVYDGSGGTRYYGGVNTNQNYGQNTQPDVAIYRDFKNSDANGLGIALPAGKARFYRMDSDGQLEFTGENTIDHTPKNETIRVYLGNAFDLVGERTCTEFYKHPSRNMMRETFEIEVRNRSEESVQVQIIEHLYRGSNWTIEKHSDAFTQTNAQSIEFPVTIPAETTKTVSYTVEYTW
ncbi:hypothetical protein QEH59_13945 [Coraliomargarita sp. SDUM461004]|uniref:DUF4139 domain-containing protein n=1 Tax=Thalassobacterium sedimentorum TaxID=3041258 RepID=A0ABU1AL50_9BACT|nr:DUF4139 domain-containing protein [Coraliomargarita sp. SDUM461004]MDQ8195530.1 hypothetical protein [Coraliomargarita sp. SDUM461004]